MQLDTCRASPVDVRSPVPWRLWEMMAEERKAQCPWGVPSPSSPSLRARWPQWGWWEVCRDKAWSAEMETSAAWGLLCGRMLLWGALLLPVWCHLVRARGVWGEERGAHRAGRAGMRVSHGSGGDLQGVQLGSFFSFFKCNFYFIVKYSWFTILC